MNIAYLAITNICNYKCENCPYKCIKKNIMQLKEFKQYIDKIQIENNIQGVVLSGGEPTIHPNFLEMLEYINKKNMYVTLLTNGSKLSKDEFVEEIEKKIDINRLHIVMTIYNIDEKMHDNGTGIKGSYKNTIEAFELLIKHNIKVSLKHCISKENYKKLDDFFKLFDNLLPVNVTFQLTTLDFSGINLKQMKKNYFLYKNVKKYLNKALENFNKERKLIIVNTPLCSANEKYWNYFIKKQKKAYDAYKSAKTQTKETTYDCDCFSYKCKECKAYNFCPGVYKTNYEFIGDKLINPIKSRRI